MTSENHHPATPSPADASLNDTSVDDPRGEASPTDNWDGLGLRQRKRLRAMRRIQTVALDLFEQHGFDAVTIEQIAAHCEVSPSTIYRYFGTKEALVIWDEYDPLALQAIVDELDQHPPLEAVRRVVHELMGRAFEQDDARIRRRMRLAFTTPSIEAASTLQAHEMGELIAAILAQRLERPPDSLDIQIFAHAFVGALLGGLRHWYASDFATPFHDVIERSLAALEDGLDLS